MSSHDPILESLREIGAELKSKLAQKDYYFTPPLPKKTKKGSILRIREETYHGGISRVMLSFKTPNTLKNGVEAREEIEVEVLGEVQTLTKLLEKLEAKPLVSVIKKRTEYTLAYENVEVTVALDQVDTLGAFVEIELLSNKKEDINTLVVLGEKLLRRLGIDPSRKINLGYHELMLDNKVGESSRSCHGGDRSGGDRLA